MNSINNTLNGLASSLLLNIGLTSVAEKLDPMRNQNGKSSSAMMAVESCEGCIWVCYFAPEVSQ